ncbi:thiamine pyrophosphokinase [Clostridium collagenovorans DSM 3089]|uniref:Thiamine diphosphokinase n=1 Tax=Clostridium collagenovorans DSM 3089 TaxID=1121306 RepID=A0A1M5SSM6_9CLOT|nr:thiamine diphosphokinase [Clostridium collagenovorans]SHH41480.1 thiamine pyrophosphokinase [Clostridium collagenovorans DSM 3089]
MKVLIVTGGSKPNDKLLLQKYEEAELVIAADSGCNVLYENALMPNIILGDFDSVDKNILEEIKKSKIEVKVYNPEKDYTDTELAVYKAIELGARQITMLGATGSRLDHVMANIGLLNLLLDKGIKASIIDSNNEIFIINKDTVLQGVFGQTFSLQAYEGVVKNLTIKNAKYELKDYDLKVGSPLTVSNEFLHGNVEINFESGKLIVFYTQD